LLLTFIYLDPEVKNMSNQKLNYLRLLSEQEKILLIKMFLYKEYKKQLISNLDKDDISAISQIFPATTYVTEKELRVAKGEPEYIEILNLFKKSKEQAKIDTSLAKIFEENKKQVLRLLKSKKGNINKNILKYLEYDIKGIENGDIPFLSLSDNMLQAKMELNDIDILEYYSFIVYNPKCQSVSLMFTDYKWQDFPLKWLFNELKLVKIRELFLLHKENKDVAFYFTDKYQKRDFTNINKYLQSPFLNLSHINLLGNRKEIIHEIIECYKYGLYASTIYTALSQIEGLIWDFSFYLDKYELSIETDRSREVTTIELLNTTKMKEYFDENFLRYFCDELYNENLHGNETKLLDSINAAKKIATLEYLLATFVSHIESEISEIFTQLRDSLPQKYIDDLLKSVHDKKDKL
jgi:hypothetical protein